MRFKSAVILLLRYLVMWSSNWLEFTHVLTYFVTGRMKSFFRIFVLFSTKLGFFFNFHVKTENITFYSCINYMFTVDILVSFNESATTQQLQFIFSQFIQ